ncbi:MAG: tRNA (guanine(6)-N2)-methyltransferase [Candidatus Nezhaarchaeota archaeon]|nr:tRNA (guanine(6)-N2)-methyltransferase [Candidatus Nezhaarchaeota archaeon]
MGLSFLATTIEGMEDVAAGELELLGASITQVGRGKLFFQGSERLIYRVNLRSRCIHKLILVLGRGEASSLSEIYDLCKSIEYSKVMGVHQSFAVRTTRVGRHEYTSIDISSVIGKAVIDYFNSLKRARPKVNLKNPDVEIDAYVKGYEVIVGVNTTGDSLHKRNYRVYDHPAAVKSTLASCMIRMSGWQGEGFLDPMCGGGTIPVEAALAARRIPPGFFRKRMAFTNLLLYDPNVHGEELEMALEESNKALFGIYGFDISPKHIKGALLNAASAGVEDTVEFAVRDSTNDESYRGLEAKYIVVNPPYGIRQYRQKALKDLYTRFLRAVSLRLSGSILVLATGAPEVLEEALNRIGYNMVVSREIKHGNLPVKIYRVTL